MSEDLKLVASASDLTELVKVTSTQRDRNTKREIIEQHEHEIRPFTFRQFFKVTAHLERVFNSIKGREVNFDDTMGLFQLALHACAEAGDDVMALLAIAIGRDVAYFDTLSMDDGAKLLVSVIKVNKSFFEQKVMPMLTTLTPATSVEAVGATS